MCREPRDSTRSSLCRYHVLSPFLFSFWFFLLLLSPSHYKLDRCGSCLLLTFISLDKLRISHFHLIMLRRKDSIPVDWKGIHIPGTNVSIIRIQSQTATWFFLVGYLWSHICYIKKAILWLTRENSQVLFTVPRRQTTTPLIIIYEDMAFPSPALWSLCTADLIFMSHRPQLTCRWTFHILELSCRRGIFQCLGILHSKISPFFFVPVLVLLLMR